MRYIVIVILFFIGLDIQAQDIVQISGNIIVVNKAGHDHNAQIGIGDFYYTILPKTEADALNKEIAYKIKKTDSWESYMYLEEVVKKMRMHRIWRNGAFRAVAVPGMSILIIGIEDNVVKVVDIVEGKTEYNDIKILVYRIDEVSSVGKAAERIPVPRMNSEYECSTDGKAQYHINIRLPAGQVSEQNRITIRPFVVDCFNGDTINYLEPLNYFGNKYRKHHKNLLLEGRIGSQIPEKDKEFIVDTIIIESNFSTGFRKTTLGYEVSIEDNRQTVSELSYPGSCLVLNPLKFLQPPTWSIELSTDNTHGSIKRLKKQGDKYVYYEPTPEECVNDYLLHRDEYIEGSRYLSDEEFALLFQQIKDPQEIKMITNIAYNEMIKNDMFEKDWSIAPYVCNYIATQKMRYGTPDMTVLSRFISYYRQRLNYKESPSMIMNQAEIVANQVSIYLYSLKNDTANYLLRLLDENSFDTKGIHSYINFKKEYGKTGDFNNEYLEDVLNICDENKAVLYTELVDLGMRDEAMQWIDKMDDDNPIKWYLKAIVWAGQAGFEPEYEGIPYYLAYLYHCFTLNPMFKDYYTFDAQFSDELRKKFEYVQANASEYESLFNIIEDIEE